MAAINYKKNHQTMTYESEYRDVLDRLRRENGTVRSLECFLDTAEQWFQGVRKTPEVTVLGPGVPEELIYAAGAVPRFVLGGSLKAAAWSDDLVPRDTDPVSRSLLGFLQVQQRPEETLFLVSVTSDSMRKTADLLIRHGRKVHIIDVPPQRRDPAAREKWQVQMLHMTEAVARHTRTLVTKKRLLAAVSMVDGARQALREFLALTWGREDLLTGTARLLVQNSYYYTEDLAGWTRHLRLLTGELQGRRSYPVLARQPGVLLLGSPVYFPNYKIPFLLEETGLTVLRNVDVTTQKLLLRPALPKQGQSLERQIRAVADRWYRWDGSPAYAVNEPMYQSVARLLKEGRLEGVVYHVLKGQIEYDFELERFEELFDKLGIPVFRLETDYQYQDVEQLRIRMEAFSEMLTQNRYREERKAQ